VNLQCSTDAEIWAIPAIEKGLYELVENGVKHSDREPASVEISVAANTNTIEITIQDNGPGVPEMERRIVSEQKNISPLFHGSGLGIWLAKFAISQSEGSLTFDDASGDGSRIEITLPVFAQ
jgi:K+-sensing histidine kinase KdpD